MEGNTSITNGIQMLQERGPVTQRWALAWGKFFSHLYDDVKIAVRRRIGQPHEEEAAAKAFEIAMAQAAEKGLPEWVKDGETMRRYLVRVAICRALNLLR